MKEQVDMLCLQETKKEMVDRTVCQALWGDSKVKWAANPAVNGAGGTNLKMKIPSKVAHFVWRLVRDRLSTRANLRRRNVQLDDYHCPFCSSHEEEASHIFFGCQRI